MTQFKLNFLIGFVCLCIGASLSLFKKPEIQIKEVVKTVETEKTASNLKKNTTTKIVETQKPDGTIVKETVIVNLDEKNSTKQNLVYSENSKEQNVKLLLKHTIELKQTINKDLVSLTQLSYKYKILDPLFVQGDINQKGDASLSIGIGVSF